MAYSKTRPGSYTGEALGSGGESAPWSGSRRQCHSLLFVLFLGLLEHVLPRCSLTYLEPPEPTSSPRGQCMTDEPIRASSQPKSADTPVRDALIKER